MIILRQKIFFKCDELYENWKKSGDPKDAYEYMNIWTNEVYIPARKKGVFVDPDPRIVRAAASYKKSQGKQETLKELGRETDKDIREAVKGTKAEKEVNKILKKSGKEMKEAAQKEYSKQNREIVPADIVKKVKDGGGVIQKDHNGDWRIISMKTKTNKSGMPEFWNNAKFKTKAEAEDCLQAYWVNKRK